MQHTLLPLEERMLLRREYRTRMCIVACFVIAGALAIGIGSLFPAYIRVTLEERTQIGIIASQKNKEGSEMEQIQREFTYDGSLISLLESGAASPKYSEVVDEIVGLRNTVRITALAVDRLSTTTARIQLQGVSPTRESLVSFKSRLEHSVPGALVELPVSELAKSRDIVFSMVITKPLP